MKTVLFVVSIRAHFIELFRVATLLQRTRQYHPIIFFSNAYPEFQNDVASCLMKEIQCLDPSGNAILDLNEKEFTNEGDPDKESPLRKGWSSLKDIIKHFISPDHFFVFQIRNLVLYSYSLIHAYVFAYRLLGAISPRIIIFAEDNVGYAYTVGTLIRVGHLRSIPSVIIPYTIATELEPAEAYYQNPRFFTESNLFNRYVAWRHPKWVYTHKGQRLLRLPYYYALPIQWFGLAPPHPWILNSGNSDVIAVESERMHKQYLDQGLPARKLVITGAVYDDVIAQSMLEKETRRQQLYQSLGLSDSLPMVLCALPPNQLPRTACDFDSYPELIDFWLQTLVKVSGYNIVISVHPRDQHLTEVQVPRHNIRISDWDTAELIGLCDIYIASVSATIRWAIAAEKPVLNYDVYKYQYTDYLDVQGVVAAQTKEDFARQLSRMTQDRDYFLSLVKSLQNISKSWGYVDGRSGERLLQLIAKLMEIDG